MMPVPDLGVAPLVCIGLLTKILAPVFFVPGAVLVTAAIWYLVGWSFLKFRGKGLSLSSAGGHIQVAMSLQKLCPNKL